jgi:sugar diacid utilization regulator
MSIIMPPQQRVNDGRTGGIEEVLELLAGGAPPDAIESVLDDSRRFGVTGTVTVDALATAWQILRVHGRIQRGLSRESGLAALVDAARDLAMPYDSTTGLMQVLARRARHLLGMDVAYVTMVDGEDSRVRIHAADGHTSGLSVGLVLPGGDAFSAADGLVGTAPFCTHDLLTDERVVLDPAFEELVRVEKLQAMITVPLSSGDHPDRARLYVAGRRAHHFTPEERSLFSSLGVLAAGHLKTTRLRFVSDTQAADFEKRLTRVAATADGLREYGNLQATLLDVLVADRDLRTLAAVGADSLGGRMTVYDPVGNVLATAGGAPAGDDGVHAAAAGMLTEEPAPMGDGRWVVPLCNGSEYAGALVLAGHGDLPTARRQQFRLVAQVAVLILRRDGMSTDPDEKVRQQLLDEALGDGHGDPRRLADRARRIGLDLSRPHVLTVARPETGLRCRADAWASAYVRRSGGLRGSVSGDLVLLLPGDDAGSAARAAAEALESEFGTPVSVGAAGPFVGVESLRSGHHDAVRGLEAMMALGVTGGGASLRELGFVGVLVSSGEDVAGFIEAAVGPVLEYDRERFTDLVPTLQAYFEAGSSPTYAAERLHVHTNTVTRRLDRMRRLLGPDWQEPARALEIQLALRMLRVRELLSNPAGAGVADGS